MDYKVRIPKLLGDVIPLHCVADAMATAKATAFGAAPFHKRTCDGVIGSFRERLLEAVMKDHLKVCDQDGFEVAAKVLGERAKQTGAFLLARRFIVEPDWAALEAKHPERKTESGAWDWTGIDLGKSEVDKVSTALHCLHSTLKQLNDWGSSQGHSFSIDPDAPPWIDERGVMGLPDEPPAGDDATPASNVGSGGMTPTIRTNRLRNRTNILAPVIEKAKEKALAPNEPQSVWASLVQLAEATNRPAPLLGFVDGEGVKYQANNGPVFFTLKNLRDRMNRKSAKAR
jgi:hypothetical protein